MAHSSSLRPLASPRTLAIAAIVVIAAGIGGCSSHRSCDLDTSNIILRAVIIDDDDGIQAEVELSNGAGDGYASLELCTESGDSLSINGHDATEVNTGDQFFYVVSFDEPETDYRVTFTRVDSDEKLVAEVSAPESFSIVDPTPLAELSRAAITEVVWEPAASGEILLSIGDELGVACLEGGFEQPVADEGTFSLPASTFVPGSDLPQSEVCDMVLALSRRAEGEVAGGLSGLSTIDAVVARRQNVYSVP